MPAKIQEKGQEQTCPIHFVEKLYKIKKLVKGQVKLSLLPLCKLLTKKTLKPHGTKNESYPNAPTFPYPHRATRSCDTPSRKAQLAIYQDRIEILQIMKEVKKLSYHDEFVPGLQIQKFYGKNLRMTTPQKPIQES